MRALVAPVLLATAALAGCTAPEEPPADVYATIYPLAFFASETAGADFRVASVVPPGTEPHDWEPSPRDAQRIGAARAFLYNGAGLEPWAERLAAEVAGSGTVVVEVTRGLALRATSDGTDPDGGHAGPEDPDPHVWLDPVLAQAVVDRVLEGLRAADPPNATTHGQRAGALKDRLAGLDAAFRGGLADCANRNILTTHAAFGYPAARYDFTQWSIAGVGPEAEPSPARVREMVDLARRLNLTHVFFETLVSPRVAEVIAEEVGARTLVLDPAEGLTPGDRAAGRGYFEIMEGNLRNLRTAMGCA